MAKKWYKYKMRYLLVGQNLDSSCLLRFTIITVLCFLRLKRIYDSIICILLDIPCYYITIYKFCNYISFKNLDPYPFFQKVCSSIYRIIPQIGLISKVLFGWSDSNWNGDWRGWRTEEIDVLLWCIIWDFLIRNINLFC